MPSALIRYRDAAVEAQEERYERLRSGLAETQWQSESTGSW
jgi:hypothetical protein